MPTPTYIPLANVTIATSTASVTLSSIPASYRDLVIVTSIRYNIAADIDFRFNGDTGNNYSHVVMAGNGSSAVSDNYTSNTMRISYYGSGSTTAGNHVGIVQIMDYSATDKHKTSLARSNRADSGVDASAIRWANTAAINSITLLQTNGRTLEAGATIALYGIAS